MSFYRSDTVNHYKIVLPRDSAWEIMNILGQNKLVHIVPNITPLLSRPFLPQVKRCEQTLLKIHNLQAILQDKGIYTSRTQFPTQAYTQLYKLWNQVYKENTKHSMSILNDVISQVEQAWGYFNDLNKRQQQLMGKMMDFRENVAIIRAGEKQFGRSFFTNREQRIPEIGQVLLGGQGSMRFKCGVIGVGQQLRFKKTVFRITKGNSLVVCKHFVDVFNDCLPSQSSRTVFFVLYPGGEQSYFNRKISKLVNNFCGKQYALPEREADFDGQLRNCQIAYLETSNLLKLTQLQYTQYLDKITQHMAESTHFRRHQYLKLYLIKQRELYSSLNEMQLFNSFLQGEIYVRRDDVEALQKCLMSIQSNTDLPAGQLVTAGSTKYPTHFVRNDFTRSAQQIVQTYGVPQYKQANPSFFTVITFPFLFGVMFGDIAHGTLLFLFGLYLIFKGNELFHKGLKILLPHRYLFTLMGFFSIYCGLIYNDYLSISLNLFGSCYEVDGVESGMVIEGREDCVYPVGLDPVWSVSENYLNFVNSLKMKIAVIIGVVHMTLGVFVKASNSLYFQRYMDLFFEFIPQLTFMVLLFGYMDFLIIYKWTVDWGFYPANAPSIITTMINMPLHLGQTDDCCGGQPMWGNYGDTSQDSIQKAFVIVAICCVPLMLLPKPLIQIYWHSSKYRTLEEEKELREEGRLLASSQVLQLQHRQAGQADHDSGQIFVHQLIETIEYALGCISNTASYLRLWALSLAHSQLSEVFFEKTVEGSLQKGFSGIPGMLIGFVILSCATFGVLLGMDSMECFLHTLRLHWVEFQNKFYKGDGFAFEFYNFEEKIDRQLRMGN